MALTTIYTLPRATMICLSIKWQQEAIQRLSFDRLHKFYPLPKPNGAVFLSKKADILRRENIIVGWTNYRVSTMYWPWGQYCVPTPGGIPPAGWFMSIKVRVVGCTEENLVSRGSRWEKGSYPRRPRSIAFVCCNRNFYPTKPATSSRHRSQEQWI